MGCQRDSVSAVKIKDGFVIFDFELFVAAAPFSAASAALSAGDQSV